MDKESAWGCKGTRMSRIYRLSPFWRLYLFDDQQEALIIDNNCTQFNDSYIRIGLYYNRANRSNRTQQMTDEKGIYINNNIFLTSC